MTAIFNEKSPLAQLLDALPQTGEVVWIGIRPSHRAPMKSVDSLCASPEDGLDGDWYKARSAQRQVTLLQSEHLAAIASFTDRNTVVPESLRRNLVVRGINLLALRGRNIMIGAVELKVTGLCHPCRRMEETLGEGGYNAVRGHGGITAQILTCGQITVGDSVRLIAATDRSADSEHEARVR